MKNVSFIDMGFNKTSIVSYNDNNIAFLDVLPLGGNHITKDLAEILKIDLLEAEKIKLLFDKNENYLHENKLSLDLIQKIIFARIEEILELSSKSIKLNSNLILPNDHKMILMGEGSKILDNKFKEKILFFHQIDLLDEETEDICQSGRNINEEPSKQEVVIIPKKQIKQGFFEKLFHFFK